VSVLVRIEDAPPAARFAYFRDAVASAIAPFEVRVSGEGTLHGGTLSAGSVGRLGVTRAVWEPPGWRYDSQRTPALIRRSDPELFKLDVQVRGRTVLAQGGREAVLGPGDLSLIDLARPSEVHDIGNVNEIVVVQFPHAALPLRHDELERVTAVRVPATDGLAAPISALARHLALSLADHAATDGIRLSAAFMDLVIVALAQRLDRVDAVSSATRHRALFASVQAFIDQRLADPRLSPAAIAAAHHVSLRLLQRMFEEQGTSVGRWMRERRLERCRRDLLDPARADVPASAIAHGWGFADAAHFTRLFRAAYGYPPGEYRRLGKRV
jgi:AraC-like DNA-binding protein